MNFPGILSDIMPPAVFLAAVNIVLLFIIFLLIKRRKKTPETENGAAQDQLLYRISRQLDELESISSKIDGLDRAFRIPRIRGGFGETLLEELLRSWLPEGSWSSQYSFSDGTRVDTVIKTGRFIVPVDSKFPMESIESWLISEEQKVPADIKRKIILHADSIAKKYIRVNEGTLDFAIMYLPAENIHYKILSCDDGSIIRECISMKVLPCGPLSLFAYLQTVAFGLKGMKLSVKEEELRRRIGKLRRDFDLLEKVFATTTTHMKNLQKNWNEMERLFYRAGNDLEDFN